MTLEGFFTKIQHLYTFVLVTFCVADGLMKGLDIFEPRNIGLASGQSCRGHIENQNRQFLPLHQWYGILQFFEKTFDSQKAE